MSREISEAKSELEAAQSALEAALRAWDESRLGVVAHVTSLDASAETRNSRV